VGPVDVDRLRSASLPSDVRDDQGDLAEFLRSLHRVDRDRTARVFTDDWSPIELMTDFEIFDALRTRRP